jgi:hypothetical protein
MTTGRLLVAYSNAATHVSTTMEYLSSIAEYSSYEVSYVHVTHDAQIGFDLDQFDAVLNSYCARLCFSGHVSRSYIEALKRFRGVRLIAVQDEYDRTNTLRDAIREIGFHVVFTCVPSRSREFVYPSQRFPEVEFITVLTGYMPSALKGRWASRIPLVQRPVVIGYRGRQLRGHYGRLGFDKYEIGRRMREICTARMIECDIETTEENRFYGEAWSDFLGRCRATLGTESGSNVFDFDGSLEAKYNELQLQKNGELSYDEFRQYTDPCEKDIEMGQISPRIFEAAATGTPMVLFSGRYSGIIVPGEHYIELKKDFSNIDHVLEQIDDIDGLSALADRAYGHLVASGSYDYRRFVATIDDAIQRRRDGSATPQSLGMARARSAPAGQTLPLAISTSAAEQPTPLPRDIIYFYYKQLFAEHEMLKNEFSKFNCLQSKFVDETCRLNRELCSRQFIINDIARLNRELVTETALLNNELCCQRSEFINETGRLARELKYLQTEFTGETGRLLGEIDHFRTEIDHFRTMSIVKFALFRVRGWLVQSFPAPTLSPLRRIRMGLRRHFRGVQTQ